MTIYFWDGEEVLAVQMINVTHVPIGIHGTHWKMTMWWARCLPFHFEVRGGHFESCARRCESFWHDVGEKYVSSDRISPHPLCVIQPLP